jgi:hypothetical protein
MYVISFEGTTKDVLVGQVISLGIWFLIEFTGCNEHDVKGDGNNRGTSELHPHFVVEEAFIYATSHSFPQLTMAMSRNYASKTILLSLEACKGGPYLVDSRPIMSVFRIWTSLTCHDLVNVEHRNWVSWLIAWRLLQVMGCCSLPFFYEESSHFSSNITRENEIFLTQKAHGSWHICYAYVVVSSITMYNMYCFSFHYITLRL